MLLVGVNIKAQSILWQKTYGGGLTETVSKIEPTLDSGFAVAANTSSTNGDVSGYHEGQGSDCWVIKLNSSNQLQWQRAIGGSGNDVATSIRATTDSGFVLAGYSNSNDGDVSGNNGGYDFLVVKLDKNNNILWQKSIGGSGDDFANDIRQTTDGGFIVAGYSNSNDALVSGNHGAYDFWVVKLATDGSVQWQNSYGGLGTEKAAAIQQTKDGGYIVAGNSNSNDGNLTNNNGNNDFWVIKLSPTGTLVWQKSLGGSGNDFASSVIQSTDGGYAVAGYTFSIDGDITKNQGNYDFWLVKLDSVGNTQWQNTYGGSDNDYARAVIQSNDGGYVMGGYTASADGDILNNQGYDDEIVIKVDAMGNMLWSKTYGGSNNDRLFSITKADGSNFCVAGITSSWDGDVNKNQGSYDCWVVKIADASPLPLKLVSFNAVAVNNQQTKSALLKWNTENESGIDSFFVEKSNDGEHYNSIGKIKASNKVKASYSFTDKNPISGINYYRLKIVETGGKSSYSNTEMVVFEGDRALIVVYPNPTTLDAARVRFSNVPAGNYTIGLFDLNGKNVSLQKIVHNNTNTLYSFTASGNVPKGCYLVEVRDNKGLSISNTKMFIK